MSINEIMSEITSDLNNSATPVEEVVLYGETVTTVADLASNRAAYDRRQDEIGRTKHAVVQELEANLQYSGADLVARFPAGTPEPVISQRLKSKAQVVGTKRNGSPQMCVSILGEDLGGAFAYECNDDQDNAQNRFNFYQIAGSSLGDGILIQRVTNFDYLDEVAYLDDKGKPETRKVLRQGTDWHWVGFVPVDRLPWSLDMTTKLLNGVALDAWKSRQVERTAQDETDAIEEAW